MRTVFFIALICSLNSFSQRSDLEKRYRKEETQESIENQGAGLGSRGLNRFFFDGVIGGGWIRDHGVSSQNEYGFTSGFRIGNNFYLGKGNSPMIIRLTYLRIGLVGNGWGIYPYIIPPGLGLAKHFKFSETVSFEPAIHAGYIFTNGDALDWDFDPFGFYVMPEIKFNFSRLSIGVEYSTKKDSFSLTHYQRYHYFGISIGRRFGRR